MPDEQKGQELEQSVQTEVTTVETPAELPDDAKERTKLEFEKLKEHNRQLAEENERLKTVQPHQQSVLENLSPQASVPQTPNLTQVQVDDIVKGLVDENGYLDQALLENTLRKANQQVAEAKAMAEQARSDAAQARNAVSKYEETRQIRLAYKKFPSLNPENKGFDPVFFRQVNNELIGSAYEGRKLSLIEACREVSNVYSPKKNVAETKAKAVDEYKKDVALKGALNETGKSRPETGSSKNDLVDGTRKGDASAIFARLQNI